MWIISFVVLADKVVELIAGVVLLANLPVKEGAEGVALHEAVKQSADLLWLPYKLALDGRQHELMAFDLVECLLDRYRCLVHHESFYGLRLRKVLCLGEFVKPGRGRVGCRETKPSYRVFRRGLTTDIFGLGQLVMC